MPSDTRTAPIITMPSMDQASAAPDTLLTPPVQSGDERKSLKYQSAGSSIDSDTSHQSRRRLNMPMMYQMYESQYEDLRGTVYGPNSPDFHPARAGERLRAACSGMVAETNDQDIINVIVTHDNFQRQKIQSAYEDMYKRSLTDDLEEEMGGFFLDASLALLKPAHQLDTHNLYLSISNRYGDRSVAIEIACTRSAKQLRVIRETYSSNYKKTLEKDIATKVEGTIGKMLTLLLCKTREESAKRLDEELVNKHREILLQNSIEEIAKNVQLFEQIFIGNSWKHMTAVFDKFDEQRKDDRDLENAIRRNKVIHSESRLIMLTCVRVARNMQLYFADKLRVAMTGDKPDHQTIIRICVSRSEIDLFDIAEEYKRKYSRPLDYDLQQTCSGDYLRLIVTLLSGANNNLF